MRLRHDLIRHSAVATLLFVSGPHCLARTKKLEPNPSDFPATIDVVAWNSQPQTVTTGIRCHQSGTTDYPIANCKAENLLLSSGEMVIRLPQISPQVAQQARSETKQLVENLRKQNPQLPPFDDSYRSVFERYAGMTIIIRAGCGTLRVLVYSRTKCAPLIDVGNYQARETNGDQGIEILSHFYDKRHELHTQAAIYQIVAVTR